MVKKPSSFANKQSIEPGLSIHCSVGLLLVGAVSEFMKREKKKKGNNARTKLKYLSGFPGTICAPIIPDFGMRTGVYYSMSCQ